MRLECIKKKQPKIIQSLLITVTALVVAFDLWPGARSLAEMILQKTIDGRRYICNCRRLLDSIRRIENNDESYEVNHIFARSQASVCVRVYFVGRRCDADLNFDVVRALTGSFSKPRRVREKNGSYSS